MSTSRSFLAAIAAGFLLVACGGGSSGTASVPTPSPPIPTPAPTDTKNMKIQIDSTFIKSVPVGQSTGFDLDIQDVGTVDHPGPLPDLRRRRPLHGQVHDPVSRLHAGLIPTSRDWPAAN